MVYTYHVIFIHGVYTKKKSYFVSIQGRGVYWYEL